MAEEQDKQCDSVFSPTKGQVYRCELRVGHEGVHRWCVQWYPEEEGDPLG